LPFRSTNRADCPSIALLSHSVILAMAGTSPGTNDEQKDANRLLMAAASQLAAPRGPRHLRAAA
jgi:hypothetical protein